MTNLKKVFEKESQNQKGVLVCVAVAFLATFFPWFLVLLGPFGGIAMNGWHSFGLLTVLASATLIALWVLPKFGVKINLPIKKDILQKWLAVAVLVGPAFWLLQTGFNFSSIGFGLYLALAAGIGAVYFSFKT